MEIGCKLALGVVEFGMNETDLNAERRESEAEKERQRIETEDALLVAECEAATGGGQTFPHSAQ